MNRLRRVLDRHRPAFVLAALLLVATLLPRGPFGIRARMAGVLSPLALLGGVPELPPAAPGQPTNLREEADSLLAQVEALKAENRALREFRSLKLEERRRDIRAVAANVVGRNPAWPTRRSIVLDRGGSDGLRPGLPVVVGRCLVGHVVEVGPGGCLVQLLDDPAPRTDDPKVRLGVDVFRPGAANSFDGALFGGKGGVLWVDMLPGGSTAKGDLVVTSSSDPDVPAGLLVGSVVAVEENRRLKKERAEVRPSADLAGLRQVYVLILPELDKRFSRAGAR